MCGIFASFSNEKIRELAELNSYRGSHSYSLTEYVPNEGCRTITRGMGEFDRNFSNCEGFKIGHIQAPTANTDSGIHPAEGGGSKLWHNGLIKTNDVKRLQNNLPIVSNWDTELLLNEIQCNGFESLSEIDGSFACFMITNANILYVFRNDISPLFFHTNGDFSSTKLSGVIEFPANIVCKIIVDQLHNTIKLENICKFKTKANPYFFND